MRVDLRGSAQLEVWAPAEHGQSPSQPSCPDRSQRDRDTAYGLGPSAHPRPGWASRVPEESARDSRTRVPEPASVRPSASRGSRGGRSEYGSRQAAPWSDIDDVAETAIFDLGLRDRQAAGLAVLFSLATSVPVEGLDRRRVGAPPTTPAAGQSSQRLAGQGRLAAIRLRVAQDHLLRNALYLMLNSGLQAGFGFAFWIITARLFSAADVGQASSLLSATTVIAYLSLLGLNTTFGRYLPTARDRDTLITTGLLAVGICGATIGLLYALLTPVLAPRVDFVAKHPWMAAAFTMMTAAAAINLLTDSVFVASRRASLTALVDGGIGGVGKIIAALALIGTGAWGLYLASAIGIVLSVVASLVLIAGALHSRPALRQPLRTLRPWLRFSGANYVGNILYLAPTLVVPLIVLDRLGSVSAAYYFIAFQIASALFAAAVAVEQTFLAEGSRRDVNMRELRRRSGRTLALLCIPATILMVATGHWLLLVFGRQYYTHAGTSLIFMALAAGPVAIYNWLLTLLRLSGKLGAIVLSNFVFAFAICGLAWTGAAHGVTGVAVAWPIGALLAVCVARIAAPRRSQPRHRMGRSRGSDGDAQGLRGQSAGGNGSLSSMSELRPH
jgi:O-antigen/teichoic acid export membrane protein